MTLDATAAEERELFKIGSSSVFAKCEADTGSEGEPLQGRLVVVRAGPNGAVITTNVGNDVVEPNGEQPIIGDATSPAETGPDLVAATVQPFAVFDGGGTSASGTIAMLIDLNEQRCVVTIQAAG